MTTIIIIATSIYILSLVACWNYARIAYSEGGIFEEKSPTLEDLLILIPVLNTLVAIAAWTTVSPRNDKTPMSFKWLNILFFIKKKTK